MSKVLVFGATSLVGSDFVERSGLECRAAGRFDPRASGLSVDGFLKVDLSDPDQVGHAVETADASAVVNFAAKTDVNAIEKEREAGPTGPGVDSAWTVNALAPGAMAKAAAGSGAYFLTVSTDFVFDGQAGPYSETAEPAESPTGISWYGWTKAEGERAVRRSRGRTGILRISYPYRPRFDAKEDFARRMIGWYLKNRMPPLFIDQKMTPTWIPDVTAAARTMILSKTEGIVHVASPQVTTPFEFGTEMLSILHGSPVSLDSSSIDPSLAKPGAVPRPKNGGLLCSVAQGLGIPLTSWKAGVRAVAAEAVRA